jgi:hypothetical protein
MRTLPLGNTQVARRIAPVAVLRTRSRGGPTTPLLALRRRRWPHSLEGDGPACSKGGDHFSSLPPFFDLLLNLTCAHESARSIYPFHVWLVYIRVLPAIRPTNIASPYMSSSSHRSIRKNTKNPRTLPCSSLPPSPWRRTPVHFCI